MGLFVCVADGKHSQCCSPRDRKIKWNQKKIFIYFIVAVNDQKELYSFSSEGVLSPSWGNSSRSRALGGSEAWSRLPLELP